MTEPTRTAKWLGLLLMLSSAPLALLGGLALLIELSDTRLMGPLIASSTYLLGAVSMLAGGFGFLRSRAWARPATLVGALLGLGAIAYLVAHTFLGVALFGAPHAVAIFVLMMPAFDVSPNYDEVRAPRLRKRYMLVGTLFVGVSLTLWLAEDEIRELAWDLREERWQAKCEATGQREVCGRWAMRQIFRREEVESMQEGLAMLDQLCAQKQVHLACEYGAKLRSEKTLGWMFGYDSDFFKRRTKGAREACRAEKPNACLVEAWLRGTASDTSKRRGDSDAGCFEGRFAACAASDDPEERGFAELAEAQVNNPALYRATVRPEAGMTCDDGSALACFADGLNGTADVNPFADDPVPVRSLEVTMGRGCELNHGHSCYVFALRLLDQRSPAKEHVERANALLESGCEIGHQRSCWLEAMLTDPSENLDVFSRLVETACEHSFTFEPVCGVRNHVYAYQLGLEPFLVVESDAYRRMRWGCWVAGDDESCIAGGSLMLEAGRPWMPAVPPLLVQGSRLAETACRGGSAAGCRLLFEYASFQSAYGMTSEASLREKICEQVPHACE